VVEKHLRSEEASEVGHDRLGLLLRDEVTTGSIRASATGEPLMRTGLYQVLDNDPARSVIEKKTSQHVYLYDCNGRDLDIGKQLSSDPRL
jgi:hypothetical protein